jgi:hypothetical protein
MSTHDLVQTALMIALCVAIGHVLALVPNVELISAAVCCCGFLAGAGRGALIGGAAALLYFGINPNGAAPPPLLLAQILGLALIGAGGGVLRRSGAQRSTVLLAVLAGLAGFLLTLVYDLLTNTAGFLMVREGVGYVAWLVAGLSFPFPLAHVLLNTATFALAVPAVARRLARRGPA